MAMASINPEHLEVRVPSHRDVVVGVFLDGTSIGRIPEGREGKIFIVPPSHQARVTTSVPQLGEKIVDIENTDAEYPVVVTF